MIVKTGDFVYRAYTPARVGVVTEVHDMGHWPPSKNLMGSVSAVKKADEVTIKFLKGDIQRVSVLGLSNFLTLIEDHERKLANHKKTLVKLEAL